MTLSAVRSHAVGALCFLGAADLLFLNLWVFPRTLGWQRPADIDVPSLSVARAPSADPLPTPVSPPAAREPVPAPAEAVPAPGGAVPAPGANVIAVRRTFFDRGRWEPSRASDKHIAAVVALARKRPERWIFVDGHADPTGPKHVNARLSTQRANAIAERLYARGADRARVVVRTFGADRPAAKGDRARDRRRNRRVELLVVDGSKRQPASRHEGAGDAGF